MARQMTTAVVMLMLLGTTAAQSADDLLAALSGLLNNTMLTDMAACMTPFNATCGEDFITTITTADSDAAPSVESVSTLCNTPGCMTAYTGYLTCATDVARSFTGSSATTTGSTMGSGICDCLITGTNTTNTTNSTTSLDQACVEREMTNAASRPALSAALTVALLAALALAAGTI